jgi:phosphonate transport system permease protein
VSTTSTETTETPRSGVNVRPSRPRTAWKGWLTAAILAAITVWTASAIDVDVPALIDNWRHGMTNFVQLLHPDFTFFVSTLSALAETVQMAVMATAIASAVGLPISFLASRATNPNRPFLLVVRTIMNVIRAIPDLLYAAILVSVVGVGALSGTMALIMFDLAIVVKLVSEALDSVERGGQEAARASGASWVRANRTAVLPEILPNFASQVIYTLELNIRVSTVIGLVGAGGLGMLIDKTRTFYRYGELSLIIVEILVMIILLEVLSSWLRRRLTG